MSRDSSDDGLFGLVLILLYLVFKGIAYVVMLPFKLFHKSKVTENISEGQSTDAVPPPPPAPARVKCNYCMSEIDANAFSCPYCNSKSFSKTEQFNPAKN